MILRRRKRECETCWETTLLLLLPCHTLYPSVFLTTHQPRLPHLSHWSLTQCYRCIFTKTAPTRVYTHVRPHTSLHTCAPTHEFIIHMCALLIKFPRWLSPELFPKDYSLKSTSRILRSPATLARGSELLSEVVQRVHDLKQNLNTLSSF